MEKAMDDAYKIRSAALSRRSILRNALTVGGAAVFGTIMSRNRKAEAQTKAAKTVVVYQDTPHDGQRCDNCLQFVPPSSCKVVEGTISPAGWCKVYVKKPA
jgi:hypothetical protein